MLKKLFLMFGLIFCISIFAAKKLEKTPIFNSPKNPIIVAHNQRTFTITLRENPSTGFSWMLAKYDQLILAPVAHKYVAPTVQKPSVSAGDKVRAASKLIGAPGYVVWTFQVKQIKNRAVNQVAHVTMEYARPWTRKEATKVKFIVVVKAR